jgi:hypothetical protein
LGCTLITGFIFEGISRAKAEKISPDGNFVQVENHRLHYLKKGTEGPTVVLETAFDPAGHLQWMNIQEKLSKTFTTISYDRAGILWSERGTNPYSKRKKLTRLVSFPYLLIILKSKL